MSNCTALQAQLDLHNLAIQQLANGLRWVAIGVIVIAAGVLIDRIASRY